MGFYCIICFYHTCTKSSSFSTKNHASDIFSKVWRKKYCAHVKQLHFPIDTLVSKFTILPQITKIQSSICLFLLIHNTFFYNRYLPNVKIFSIDSSILKRKYFEYENLFKYFIIAWKLQKFSYRKRTEWGYIYFFLSHKFNLIIMYCVFINTVRY